MSISEHSSTASAYRVVVNYDTVFLLYVVQCVVAAMTIKILILICRLHIHDVYLPLYHIPEGLYWTECYIKCMQWFCCLKVFVCIVSLTFLLIKNNVMFFLSFDF